MKKFAAKIAAAVLLILSKSHNYAAATLPVPNVKEPVVYFTTYPANTPKAHTDQLRVLSFVTASLSHQPVIEKCVPQPTEQLNHTYSLNLQNLGWSVEDWNEYVARHYPYDFFASDSRYRKYADNRKYAYPELAPKVYRADWFIQFITDANNSHAQYALLYGEANSPKTKAEFLKYWEIDTDPYYSFGLIETLSGVAKQRVRFISNYPLKRGYVWGTKDFLKIDPTKNKDPFSFPIPEDKNLKHDGEEWIIGIPKFSSTTGKRGTLQVYALFNGNGTRIDKADGDLVEDHTRYKNFSQIRTSGSCIQCHAKGINEPHRNGLRELFLKTKEGGQEIYAKYNDKEALDRFHLSDSSTEITRNNEDYATAVLATTGLTPEKNAECFTEIVKNYATKTVTLSIAAQELQSTPNELSFALAIESSHNKKLGYALSGLPHGEEINRETWESVYLQAYHILQKYRAAKNAK